MDLLELKKIDFRLFLQNEFLKRYKENSRYSIRSFSKSLGINQGTLSQILQGKRKINDRYRKQFFKAISPDPQGLLKFSIKNENEKNIYEKKFEELTMDIFEYISDWYYDAILNLTKLKDFKCDAKWIAKTIGITIPEANIAIDRLKRLELIIENSDGTWSRKQEHSTTINSTFTTAAKKKLQKQLLNKAAEALDKIPYDKRSQSSMAMPIKRENIAIAKELIKKFRRDMSALIGADNANPDSVYQLLISFFPLTEVDKENSDE